MRESENTQLLDLHFRGLLTNTASEMQSVQWLALSRS
jgi:hypothetical protein